MKKLGRKSHHIPPLHHVLDLFPLVNLVNQFRGIVVARQPCKIAALIPTT
jgi:hypothetical protein